jgi:hypothetical protein
MLTGRVSTQQSPGQGGSQAMGEMSLGDIVALLDRALRAEID